MPQQPGCTRKLSMDAALYGKTVCQSIRCLYIFSSVKNDINNAEAFLAQTIQAKPQEIYITSGGTESDNWAVKIAAEEHRRGHIITTAMEHHAILKSCEAVEKEGFYVTYIRPAENGIVRLTDIQRAVRPDTFLISVMAANNEIGTIQPVAQIGAFARRHVFCFIRMQCRHIRIWILMSMPCRLICSVPVHTN